MPLSLTVCTDILLVGGFRLFHSVVNAAPLAGGAVVEVSNKHLTDVYCHRRTDRASAIGAVAVAVAVAGSAGAQQGAALLQLYTAVQSYVLF